MSTMRRSTAGTGKIPVVTMPSGQASSVLANRAVLVRGYLLRREDLREFRSAYNRVAASRSTPPRRVVASSAPRPPPHVGGVSPAVRTALERRASGPLHLPFCPASPRVAPPPLRWQLGRGPLSPFKGLRSASQTVLDCVLCPQDKRTAERLRSPG